MRRLSFFALRFHSMQSLPNFVRAYFFTASKLFSHKPLSHAVPLKSANLHSTVSHSASFEPVPKAEEGCISILDSNGKPVSVPPLNTFEDLNNAPDWLRQSLQRLNYLSTTNIQKYTIPALQEGHDLIGLAPTGSGKTVAFAVPALMRMRRNPDRSPSVLVLAPTRELVQQTTSVFEKLAHEQMRICEAYGGASREIQARHLERGCDLLVACPGRLVDFLQSGCLSLSSLSFLVFDEADRLLDMGFQIQLENILAYLNTAQPVQKMMWSATWPESVQNLARNYLSQDRLLIRAGTAGTGLQVNEQIKQTILFSNNLQDRVGQLVGLIGSGKIDENTAKLIIFVERQADTENAARALSRALGIDPKFVGVIHGGLSQRQRDNVMYRFKNSYIRILVATDIASRGLDIPDVTCVVNMQAPRTIDGYCHRIGRTGRAGRRGEAYTFIGSADGAISSELIDYLERCNMEVPSQLVQLSKTHCEEVATRRQGRQWQTGRRSFRRRPSPSLEGSTGW